MPKLYTLSAAIMAAAAFIVPAHAGQSGQVLRGGPAYTPATTHSAATYGNVYSGQAAASTYGQSQSSTSYSSSAASSYSSSGYGATSSYSAAGSYVGAGYANAGRGSYSAPQVDTLYVDGPANVYADNIVCLYQGTEVPCDTIPGLADALRAQGMHTIADQLPQVPASAYCDPAYVNTQMRRYTGYSTHHAGYSQHGGCAAHATSGHQAHYTQTTGYQTSASYTGQYYQQTAPTQYYRPATPVLTPCGQFVGYTCGSVAPVTVQLDNGTMYAFGGGVGAGVYGEFYGGGGTLIQGGASYSGVLNAAASRYSFRQKTSYTGGGKGGHGGGHHGGGHGGGKGDHGGNCGGGCGSGAYHGGGKGGHGGGYHGGGYHGGGHGGGYHGGGHGGGKGGHGGGSCGGGC